MVRRRHLKNPPELPASPETTTGAIRPDLSPKTAKLPTRPNDTDWVVSETTSPVDYSPLVTAFIRSTSQVKDAPNTLTIRCLGKRTVSWFTQMEHGVRRAATNFMASIRSTTSIRLASNGSYLRIGRPRPTRTIQWDSCKRGRTATP